MPTVRCVTVRGSSWLGPMAWGAPARGPGRGDRTLAGEVVIGLLRGGLLGRALSWAVLGLGIGLGQGLADRSRERLIYGLIGGGLGGFVGWFPLRVAACGTSAIELTSARPWAS